MPNVSHDLSPLGFVASETSLCDELETAASHCAWASKALLVSSANAPGEIRRLRARHPSLRFRADQRSWSREFATPEAPLALDDDLFGLDGWCEQNYPLKEDVQAFSPSRFVVAGDRDSLRALLAATTSLPANIVTLIPIEATALGAKLRNYFFEDLRSADQRPLAFVFAGKNDPLARYDHLDGLRRLLKRHPGSIISNVDPLVATDCLAHGASWAGVGASSSRRMPQRPGDGGGPLSKGYLPGLFLRDLLELRSPAVYADWYANTKSPYCTTCTRALDVFETTVQDKAAIVAHNLHQTTAFVDELLRQPTEDRGAWLAAQRLIACRRHLDLHPVGGPVKANLTLRRFVELDDPEYRETTPVGAWR